MPQSSAVPIFLTKSADSPFYRCVGLVAWPLNKSETGGGFLVSKETVLNYIGGRVKQKFGFIKRVDKG